MLEDRLPAYEVTNADDRFEVVNDDGRVCMVCRDEPSARHYAELMNQAFSRGYKSGYRDARNG